MANQITKKKDEIPIPPAKRAVAIRKAAFRGLWATFLFCCALVALQDFLIFPMLLPNMIAKVYSDLNDCPHDQTCRTITGPDGAAIEVWELQPPSMKKRNGMAAIVFRGNGGGLLSFVVLQRWLLEHGIASYSFNYAGHGLSSGWPTEAKLYREADAVADFVEQNERIQSKDLVLLAYSVGTGAAAYLAQNLDVKALILLAPYTSIRVVAGENYLFRLLLPFLRWELPVENFVGKLKNTCLIVGAAENDNVISSSLSKRVADAYRGTSQSRFLSSPTAAHHNILTSLREELSSALEDCLAPTTIAAPITTPVQ
jgi:uncharacterized protein